MEATFEMNNFDDPELKTGLLYEEVFKDKIGLFLVLAVLQDLNAFYKRKFTSTRFEIHAHAIQTILDNNYITRQKVYYYFYIFIALIIAFINRYLAFGALL